MLRRSCALKAPWKSDSSTCAPGSSSGGSGVRARSAAKVGVLNDGDGRFAFKDTVQVTKRLSRQRLCALSKVG
jgi:hypothetical protein